MTIINNWGDYSINEKLRVLAGLIEELQQQVGAGGGGGGAVASVNGQEPDEDGNVTVDADHIQAYMRGYNDDGSDAHVGNIVEVIIGNQVTTQQQINQLDAKFATYGENPDGSFKPATPDLLLATANQAGVHKTIDVSVQQLQDALDTIDDLVSRVEALETPEP